MIVYVSAPFTKGDQFVNVRTACLAGDELLKLGHCPIVPHTTALWHAISPKTFEEWLQIDSVLIGVCDAVLRLEGESVGADIETGLAQRLNIPVYYSLADVPRNNPA